MTPAAKLRLALQWAEDCINGEMIEAPNYTRQYLGFPCSVSQRELDAICLALNTFYDALASPLRVGNSMGELRIGFNGEKP